MSEYSTNIEFTGERYVPEVHGDIELEHLHRYQSVCKIVSGKVVLDIASGEGYGTSMIARTANKVIGVDISQEAISHAQGKYRSENIEFLLGSCSDIPIPDDSVDVVVSFETIEHHDEHEAMMREIKRVLRPEGVLVISSPDKREYSDIPRNKNPYHIKELYWHEFEHLLELYFKNRRIYGQRVVYGSAIFCKNFISKIQNYRLSADAQSSITEAPDAVYLIAVASDAELPILDNGILEQGINDIGVVKSLSKALSEHYEQIADLKLAICDRDNEVSNLALALTEKDVSIANLYHEVDAQSDEVVALNRAIAVRDEQIAKLSGLVIDLKGSRSWRVTWPLRLIRQKLFPPRNIDSPRIIARLEVLNRIVNHARYYHWYWSLRHCPLFDSKWYLAQNPDVLQAGVNPLRHYIVNGWKENRQPSPGFDGEYYRSRYPDIAGLEQPPLLHYWRHGRNEGRYTNPMQDPEWVVTDLKATNVPVAMLSEDRRHLVKKFWPLEDGIFISVIIPTFNRIKLLPGLIETWRDVHACTQFNYEIIFSDDGSTDGSVEYLEAVRGLPLRVLRNEHGGASKARNAAVRAASGKRLLMIGDDIFPDKDILNVHFELSQKLGTTVALLGSVDWHPELPVNHLMGHITEIGNEQFSYNRLKDCSFVDFRHFYTCNISVDRQFLLKEETIFDGRFTEYGFEDIELGYRLAARGMKLYFTSQAYGAHYHPYNLENFCRRQISAGKMAVVFSSIHPNIEHLLGTNAVARQARKLQSSVEHNELWQKRLDMLIKRCNEYEMLIVGLHKDLSIGIRECLSILYTKLFRAMFEMGVLEKLGGHPKGLAISMSCNFSDSFSSYWVSLEKNRGQSIDLSADEIFNLAEAVNIGSSNELLFGPGQRAVFDELMQVNSLHHAGYVTGGPKNNYTHLARRTFYYLKNDPRYLIHRAKQTLRQRSSRKPVLDQANAVASVEAAIMGLIVETDNLDRDGTIAMFRDVFGNSARIYERLDDGILTSLLDGGVKGESVRVDQAEATIFYWPKSPHKLPLGDHLLSAYMAIAENGLNMAIISHNLNTGQTITIGEKRDHMLFSRDIAKQIFNDAISNTCIKGKVLRLLPANGPVTDTSLDALFSAPVDIDDDYFFRTDTHGTTNSVRYRASYLPRHLKNKKVVFVFPIFLAVGGVERNTIEIMRKLNDRYDFIVITMERLQPEQGSLAAQTLEVATNLIEMPEIVRHADYLRVLARLKESQQPDFIWVCNGSPWFCDNAINIRKIFYDIPIIDQEAYDTEQGWIARYAEEGIQSFDHFIAINKKIQARFVKDFAIDSQRISLIYPTIDATRIRKFKESNVDSVLLRAKLGIPEDKKIFTFIARLTEQKRPLLFLGLAKSRLVYEDECYVLVGNGVLASDVDNYVKKYELKNVVRIPYLENIFELDAISDGIIFTSKYEGLPVAMLEAMAMNVPVFSTNVGDIADVLKDYGGGVVVPPAYTQHQLNKAFASWLEQRFDFVVNLKAHEGKILDNFSSDNTAEKYVECWNKASNEFHERYNQNSRIRKCS